MSTLPDFEMDWHGEYSGNAYPETHEYRIHVEQVGDGTQFRLWAETTSGGVVGEYTFDEEIAEDGVIAMAEINHDLGGYEDDWHLPDGMYRSIHWVIPTDDDIDIRLDESGIDAISHWLRFALGLDEYDGPSDRWEH
jgi:hypothetical protein